MDEPIGERPVLERIGAPRRTMIIHTHYDADADTSGWAVVRTLPGMLECRTGSLPHITAERAFLSTLLRELFAMPQDASISVATLTPFPVLLLHACGPWVWRMHDWHEDEQPIANADLWVQLLSEIDQRCITWHLLTTPQHAQLDALLARRLAIIAAQGGVARTVGTAYPEGTSSAEVAR